MLTLQLIPYYQLQRLSREERIERILNVVKANKVALVEGRIESTEESELIKETMKNINEKFKGIEVASLSGVHPDASLMTKLRYHLSGALLGSHIGLTIIGPAHIVSEIKQDPDKLQLLLNNRKIRKKK